MSKRYGVGNYGVNAYSSALNVAGEAVSDVVFDAVTLGSVRWASSAISGTKFSDIFEGSKNSGGALLSAFRFGTVLTRATSVEFGGELITSYRFNTTAEGRLRINHTVEMEFDIRFGSEFVGNVDHSAVAVFSIKTDLILEPYESKFWEPMPSMGAWTPTSNPSSIWVVQPNSTPWG